MQLIKNPEREQKSAQPCPARQTKGIIHFPAMVQRADAWVRLLVRLCDCLVTAGNYSRKMYFPPLLSQAEGLCEEGLPVSLSIKAQRFLFRLGAEPNSVWSFGKPSCYIYNTQPPAPPLPLSR